MEAILREVAEQGWTESRREEFVRQYDHLIGRAIIYFLARYRNLRSQELRQLLDNMEWRLKGRADLPNSELLDLVEEIYLRVYEQVFRGRLIQHYVERCQSGLVQCEFRTYLRGVVRNRVVDCLRASKPRLQGVPIEEWEEQIAEGSPDWAKALRADWWDRLIRCRGPSAKELEELHKTALALQGDAGRHTRLCLACARVKAEEGGKGKEDIRMLLAYYLSNYGTRGPSSGERKLPKIEELSLERIRGLHLSWGEIFEIFGRECNPTRVRGKVREKLEQAHYGREAL